MMDYKVNNPRDNKVFVKTKAYKKLKRTLKDLRGDRGRIVHVLGTPGTGKSANIYYAIEELGLNVYEVKCNLEDVSVSAKEVFKRVLDDLKSELDAPDNRGVYKRLSDFDAVLFADKFHDSHLLDEKVHGFSEWTLRAHDTPYFYILCLWEYLRYRGEFKELNIIFQTAWRMMIGDRKYDIFTDIPVISRFFREVLKGIFTVVEIEYSPHETFNIVKSHINADDDDIYKCIRKYGCKPRYILEELGSP